VVVVNVLDEVPPAGPWAKHGACRAVPLAAFFPETVADVDVARTVCRGCRVVEQCREYALEHPQLVGVWGAMSDDDRRKARMARKASPPPSPIQPVPADTRADRSLLQKLERQLAHPGRWVWVRHYAAAGSASAVASGLRTGQRLAPRGQWEYAGRPNPNGGSDLYARYLGAEAAAS
jgi:WhiB family transcriptional regulator, redox-sensing transcriptional regulator